MLINMIKKIIFPNTYSSDAYVEHLRKSGCEIGENCIIWSPNQTDIDATRPGLLKIGDNVKITKGVNILCHDYSRSVLRLKFGENVGEARKTIIGNNVFIGMNSVILMGSRIGNNTIVGAGSIVSGTFPDDVIIAGNPARVICNLDEYYEKRKIKSIEEAKQFANGFYDLKNRYPTIEEMGNAFSWQFLPRTTESLEKYSAFFNLKGDDHSDVVDCFMKSTPYYDSYNTFISHCIEERESSIGMKAE
ncbi:TPA: acyltransferase [Bacillus cereus]|uniref:acyltransferase n=1 Tax=Bacillus cereus group TaxID=86661 RepID=UPI0009B5527C|nr:acyltransferase [Bacillus pacificus]MCU5372185.1 acyltransferase [Bacillus pacificus]